MDEIIIDNKFASFDLAKKPDFGKRFLVLTPKQFNDDDFVNELRKYLTSDVEIIESKEVPLA